MLEGILGKVNWVAGMAKPETSARTKNTKVSELISANKVIKFIQTTPKYIIYPDISFMIQHQTWKSGRRNRGGHLVLLSDKFSNIIPVTGALRN